MFKNLTEVKRKLKVGDKILLRNKMKNKNEIRKIVKIQTNAIVTSPLEEDKEKT